MMGGVDPRLLETTLIKTEGSNHFFRGDLAKAVKRLTSLMRKKMDLECGGTLLWIGNQEEINGLTKHFYENNPDMLLDIIVTVAEAKLG